jgi:D-alanyl-D-alanine carboxypeptidase
MMCLISRGFSRLVGSCLTVGVVWLLAVPAAGAGHASAGAQKSVAPPAAGTSAPAREIDALFAAAIKPDGPGMAVILVRDGKTVFRKAYGMANVELQVPMRPEHVFRIASVTKQFTAAAIMMLVDEGKLAVSDPITKFWPDYPTQGKTITVEHLLTHTSGIQGYTEMAGFGTVMMKDMTVDQMIAFFKNEPMNFAPGEQWRYNNSAYFLLGALIEKVSGQKYAEFIATRIFQPLGMAHSYYGDTAPIIPMRVSGYERQGETVRNAPYLSMTLPFSAGSLMSTVDDLAVWNVALDAGKVVKPQSLARMFTDYRLTNGTPTSYGYGWGIGRYEGRAVQEHSGGINGFRSHVLRIPEEQVYVAVLSNLSAAEPDPIALARKSAGIAMGRPVVDPPSVVLEPAVLDRYVGIYTHANGSPRTVTREGAGLMMASGSGKPTALLAYGEDRFFRKGGFVRFRFEDYGGGKAERLVVDDWGRLETATRAQPAAERKTAAVVPATLDQLVGEYELMPGFVLTVTREGDRLMTQATGQSKIEVFPESDLQFFLKVVDAQITFVKDASGAVTSLILHQGGRDLPAKKIK